MQNKLIDTSEELVICRVGKGIRLIRPDQVGNTGPTVANLMQLPFPVYLEDIAHLSIKSNEETAKACGFVSLKDFIGKSPFKYFKKETIFNKLVNHKKVIEEKTLVIAEENALRKDESELNTLSVRMPWYNDQNKVIGLFGCSIVLGINSLAESLTHIMQLGLLNNLDLLQHNSIQPNSKNNSIPLTKRELECLRLTVLGKPAKQVGYDLGLSQRTVEEYLENIKMKMGVSSKPALIEKTIKLFFKFQ